MVFSSLPAYLDPSLWQQQQQQNQHQHQQQLQEHHQQTQEQQLQLTHSTGAAQSAGAASAAAANNNTNTFTNPHFLTSPSLPQHQTHSRHVAIVSSPPSLLRPPTSSSIRPGSMAEKARMANIPPPVRQINCPRCHSADTKFCYYNNYSLSQPRHFCKTCRRYWTNGGAMRNVPVGGCRRNNSKRGGSNSKNSGGGSTSSNSKSSPATSDRSTGSTSSAGVAIASSFSGGGGTVSRMADILGLNVPQMIPSTLRFMSMATPNHHFGSDHHHHPQFGFGSGGFGAAELGLYGGISAPPMSSINAGQMAGLQVQLGSNMVGVEQWRMQSQTPTPIQTPQPLSSFPLFGGMDGSTTTNNMYQFEGGGSVGGHHHMELSRLGVAARPDSRELGPVCADEGVEETKMEEISTQGRHRNPAAHHHHHQRQHEMEMNMTRQFHLGMNELGGGNGHQYSWVDGSGTTGGGGVSNAWTSSSTVVHSTTSAATDLSGLNSSSSTTGPI